MAIFPFSQFEILQTRYFANYEVISSKVFLPTASLNDPMVIRDARYMKQTHFMKKPIKTV